MATYDNLPVYKTSYDMLLELFQTANGFSRDYRFTIGEQIKKETIEMMMCVYRANKNFEGRRCQIGEAREKVETIRVLLRILKDLKQLNLKKFISLNEKIYLQHCGKGVQFLGTFILPWRIYTSRRTKGNFYAKIRMWNDLISSKHDLNEKEVKDFLAYTNSYLGIMKHYKTYKLRKKILDKNLSKNFWEYVGVSEKFEKLTIK